MILGTVVARDPFGITLTAVVPRGIIVYLVPVLVVMAAANAYYNSGILVSWVIVFAPLFVGFVNFIGSGITIGTAPTRIEWILLSARGGLLYTLVLGTPAFALGAGSRRVIGWIQQ